MASLEPNQHGERRNFNGDCCPSMVTMQARWADHVVGADGVNHRTIAEQMKRNDEQHVAILESLAEFRSEVNEKIGSLQRRQWQVSGALAVVIGFLTWLGPGGLRQMLTTAVQVVSMGWNG